MKAERWHCRRLYKCSVCASCREATSVLPVFLLPAGEQLLHLLQLCLERLGLTADDVELAL